jgi:hypothetical protein
MVADRLAITVNPDGVFSDEDRARKRGFVWCGRQRSDGMSVGNTALWEYISSNPNRKATTMTTTTT